MSEDYLESRVLRIRVGQQGCGRGYRVWIFHVLSGTFVPGTRDKWVCALSARYAFHMSTLWVGIGGAIGSIARYHIGLFTMRRWPGFPWGTLAVNIIGSLLLSMLMHLILRGRLDEATRIALGVGVLGGFTTYSTFNHETIALAQQGAWGRASLYVLITLAGGLAAGVLGWTLTRNV